VTPRPGEHESLFSTFDIYWKKCSPRLYRFDAAA
jgi:hypothetical protein